MRSDFETNNLFLDSNFDDFDSRADRYPAVLKAGLRKHGLSVTDVLAVTNDRGLWAICTPGIFHGQLKGLVGKQIQLSHLLEWSDVIDVIQENSSATTRQIVLIGKKGDRLVTINFSASGNGNNPQLAAARCIDTYKILRRAIGLPA